MYSFKFHGKGICMFLQVKGKSVQGFIFIEFKKNL